MSTLTEIEQVIERSVNNWHRPMAQDDRRVLATEPQRIRGISRETLSALIKDAYYHARDHGGTMHTAGDDAADAILKLLR